MSIYPPNTRTRHGWNLFFAAQILFLLLWAIVLVGCGKTAEDAALNSDANGFICMDCKTKFYTDRNVFANYCPSCRKPGIEMVVGFVCATDGHVSYAPRGKGALSCEQCGKRASGLSIPKESELRLWGAVHKSGSEVGVE
jgi:hypothetical protein